jgi:hypothetical protein
MALGVPHGVGDRCRCNFRCLPLGGPIAGLEAGSPVDHALFVAPQNPPASAISPLARGRAVVSRFRHAALFTAVLVGIAAPVAATTLTGAVSDTVPESTTTTSAEAAQTAAAAAEAVAPSTPAEPTTGPGYRILSTDGGVFTHGWVSFEGSAAGETASPTVGIAHADEGDGYWVASADGGVFAFGDAPFQGSAAGASAKPIVDIAATPSGDGYWLTASDGGVFAFGDAGYLGSGPEAGISSRIVSVAPTAKGDGYWLVGSDGGVFAFGNAPFFGSLGDQQLNARVIDLVPTVSGNGYYLVSADGGVFTFGDAAFHGAAIDERLASPIVDMALDPAGDGYWLLAADGGVFSYGGAPFLGAPVGQVTGGHFTAIAAGIGDEKPAPAPEPPAPAPGPAAAATPADATVSAAAAATPVPAEAAASGSGKDKQEKKDKNPKKGKDDGRLLDGQFGWDISYPQCGGSFPGGDFAYTIVGVNGGRTFRRNRCLAEQWQWAKAHGPAGIYVNVHFPRSPEELAAGATSDRQPDCAPGAISCVGYNFALNGIRDSLAYASSQGVDAPFVWLDVEQLNYWTGDQALNAVVIRGAIDGVREAGLDVGIYSTPYQYRKITGDEQAQVPVWSAGAPDLGAAVSYCQTRGFGGGPVALVQLLPGQFDPNLACPGAGPMSRYFSMP